MALGRRHPHGALQSAVSLATRTCAALPDWVERSMGGIPGAVRGIVHQRL
jgi:hypothetical protein